MKLSAKSQKTVEQVPAIYIDNFIISASGPIVRVLFNAGNAPMTAIACSLDNLLSLSALISHIFTPVEEAKVDEDS